MKTARSEAFRAFILIVVLTAGTLPCWSAPAVPFYNVKDYGATGDGTTKDTEAIRKAISTAAGAGGGTAYFPAGQYLTGSIHLQSNVTLHLDAGAVLKFSQDFDDYLPMVKSRWEGTECMNFSPPIYAHRAENIAIDAQKGFSCSNAKNLAFRNVRIDTQKGPALLCEKVAALEIDGVRTLALHSDSAVVDLKDVAGAYVHACRSTPGLFLRVQGKGSRDIVLQANEFGQAPSAVQIDEGVPASALIQK